MLLVISRRILCTLCDDCPKEQLDLIAKVKTFEVYVEMCQLIWQEPLDAIAQGQFLQQSKPLHDVASDSTYHKERRVKKPNPKNQKEISNSGIRTQDLPHQT